MSQQKIAQEIKCLVCDIDGVMTDGTLYYDQHGEALKGFSTQDGLGLKMLKHIGIEVAVISGRDCPALHVRLKELGINHAYLGIDDKLTAFQSLRKKLDLTAEQIAYVGDDFPDLAVMKTVALPIAVANACPPVQKVALWVTQKSGGHGAIREITDGFIDAHNKWDQIFEAFT